MIPIEPVHISTCATSNALLAAKCTDVNRKAMVSFYADCIRASTITKVQCDWAAVNAAILVRWPRGLGYIKVHALKAVRK